MTIPTLCTLFATALSIAYARTVSLSNVRLPMDNRGLPLITGEASIIFSSGAFWFYFNNWGGCRGVDCCPSPHGCASCCFAEGWAPDPCVYTANHSVLVYSSSDFQEFIFEGVALSLESRLPGIEFRPQVVFNGSDYLMWYEDRWSSGGSNPGYALASSRSPAGPFSTISNSIVLGGKGRVGDYDIFVDIPSGRGYHVRTGLSIQPLDSTLSKPEGGAVDVPNLGVEGPAMLKRNGIYYLLVGEGCCACRGGSNVVVYTAPNPLGPWIHRGDVGSNSSGHVFDPHSPWNYATRAQQTKVVEVPDGAGGTQYLWVGNQWVTSQSPGNPRNNDLLFFTVLNFKEDGNLSQIAWADTVTITLPDITHN